MNPNHKEFESIILQSFLSNRIEVNIEDAKNQEYFFNLAKSFQFSGYLLKSLHYSEKTITLKKNLERLNNNYLKKILLMRYEISQIAQLFNENNIEYVVLKGMAMRIKKIDPCRQFRDLDILILKKDLKRAYCLLKDFGYAYLNKQSNDGIKYIGDMHHLPPMINNKGIVIELHHRVTLPNLFNSCPLTTAAFEEAEMYDDIKVPSDKFLLAHILYHGIFHHELNSGPNFLLDIKNILKKNLDADNSINNLLENLNLTDQYSKSKLLIESCNHKKSIDASLIIKFNSIFKGKKIFPKKEDLQNNKISLLRLFKFIKYNCYYYQMPYWSPKLIYFVIKSSLKKLYD
jgi:hypothetical protein